MVKPRTIFEFPEMYTDLVLTVPIACKVIPEFVILTFSLYVPGKIMTASPDPSELVALRMVRQGEAWEPGLESLPVVAT